MPAKKPSIKKQSKRVGQSTSNAEIISRSDIKRGFTILLIILAIIMGAILLISFVNATSHRANMDAEREKMVTYLKDKYGQDFTVNNVRVGGGGFAVAGSIRGDAFPNSDSSLRFELRKSENKDYYDYDSFLSELWSRQAREQVDKFIKQELPDIENYSLKINPGISLRESVYGRAPSFSEVQEGQPGRFSYELSIVSLTHEVSTIPSDSELQRVFRLVGFVKAQKASIVSIVRYTYKLNDGGIMRFEVQDKDVLDSISSLDDLRNKFKKLD